MGGILDSAELQAASYTYRALFKERLAELPQLYKKLATIIENPDSAATKLDWLADISEMKEWLGDRQIEKLRAFDYSITHKDWENTIQVHKRDLKRDRVGIVKPRINAMAESYIDHLQGMVNTLVTGMFSTACYDGQYLIDTDHPLEDGSTQSNKLTAALSDSSFKDAIEVMASLKTYKGLTVHQTLSGLLLLIGPSNMATAHKIVGNKGAGQALTGYEGMAEPVVCPVLVGSHATKWALVRPRFGLMPFIISREQDVESAQDLLFMRPYYLFGVDSSDNAGYGLYEVIVGSTGEGV